MSVTSACVGRAGPTSFQVAGKVVGSSVRLAVADNMSMSGAVFYGPVTPSAQDIVKIEATGLQPLTRYWWALEVDSTLDTTFPGQAHTHPPLNQPADFTFALGGDAGQGSDNSVGSVLAADRISNHEVFSEILAHDPLWFSHTGDITYYDLGSGLHGISGGGSLSNYRRMWDDVFLQTRQHELYRKVATQFQYDDHDRGPNSHDRTYANGVNANQVYRERTPHYDMPETGLGDPLYHAWQVGRVQFISWDNRSARDPNEDEDVPGKTMLGQAQLAWMHSLLRSTDSELLVILNPSIWIHPTAPDSWASFTHERSQIVQMLGDTGWLNRMTMIGGHRHSIGIDTGSNTAGGFPYFQFTPLDASVSAGAEFWDLGEESAARGQYGLFRINDQGNRIEVTGTGRIAPGITYIEHTFTVPITPALVFPVQTAGEIVSGAHRPLFEARVVTDFQNSDEPEGVLIPVLGGDVRYDATADVFASLDLTTAGRAEDGTDLFPRRAGDLLAPYGNEIFVRRGIDLGLEAPLWVPLGYFRIDSVEQTDGTDIRISGQDRMAGIVDGDLLNPVQFLSNRTVGNVISELVRAIYPNVLIAYDDETELDTLGRDLIVEESRYQGLRDLVDSFGKIMFWNGRGILRIEDEPEPSSDVTWSVRAGFQGVLVTASRKVSREGMVNGWVVTGEGATTSDHPGRQVPLRAVVVDDGPNSPTRWGSKFGKVPRRYTSPLITTNVQAQKTARVLLRRHIGVPYSVNFGVAPNPALRPNHVILITQRNGSREKHIVKTCSIPLTAEAPVTGTTREQTKVRIGELV